MSWRQINKEKLRDLKPCEGRWKNYLKHYSDFEGDIVEFLELKHITPEDKVWVFVRVAPGLLLEIFALDCALSAVRYSAADYAAYASCAASAYAAADAAAAVDADYAAYASYAAADYSAYAADYASGAAAYAAGAVRYFAAAAVVADAANKKQEREDQVDAMIIICEGEK